MNESVSNAELAAQQEVELDKQQVAVTKRIQKEYNLMSKQT